MTTPRRIGTRLLSPHVRLERLLGPGLGEDWVVPKLAPRYLVGISDPGGGALLTAYDGTGRILGERWCPGLSEVVQRLEQLHEEGHVEAPAAIPDQATSVLQWLDARDETAPGS
jgi:hypothetical protein